MKKMLLATALAAYYRMCSTDVAIPQNEASSSSTKRETITTSFLRFWNWAKKTVDAAKFVAAQKMLLKQKLANIRKWIAQFFY